MNSVYCFLCKNEKINTCNLQSLHSCLPSLSISIQLASLTCCTTIKIMFPSCHHHPPILLSFPIPIALCALKFMFAPPWEIMPLHLLLELQCAPPWGKCQLLHTMTRHCGARSVCQYLIYCMKGWRKRIEKKITEHLSFHPPVMPSPPPQPSPLSSLLNLLLGFWYPVFCMEEG